MSTRIGIDGLSVSIGNFVVGPINLQIGRGEIVALIGPSGCGKTTLLRAIAGMLESQGDIWVDGENISTLPIETRPTALVSQTPVLFEGMSVRENVAFGLDDVRVSQAKRDDIIDIAMVNLDIFGLAERAADTLSGGQMQRVALARTLVRNPKVLLLDEPLSSVEPSLRRGIRTDIVTQVRRGGITTLYVTHDLDEAFAVADRVIMMSNGSLIQIDAPQDFYRRPASRFVAEFIGYENILACTVLDHIDPYAVLLQVGRMELVIPATADCSLGPGLVVLPSESIHLEKCEGKKEIIGNQCQVLSWAFSGQKAVIEIESEMGSLIVHEWDPVRVFDAGDYVTLRVAPNRGWVLPKTTGLSHNR